MKPLQTRKSELFVTVEAERENLYTKGTRIYLLKLRAYLLKRSYQEYMRCRLGQRQVLYYKARQYRYHFACSSVVGPDKTLVTFMAKSI